MIYIIYLLSGILGLSICYIVKKYNKTRQTIYYSYQATFYTSLPTMAAFILSYHFPASIFLTFLSSFLWILLLIGILIIVLLLDIDDYKDSK